MAVLTKETLEHLMKALPLFIDLIPGGVTFINSDTKVVTEKLESSTYGAPTIVVGMDLTQDAAVQAVAATGKPIRVPATKENGDRVLVNIYPVIEDGKVVGTFGIFQPRLHPMAAAFPSFAPIIADMFVEGAFLWVTDTQKNVGLQGSEKFDIPLYKVGDKPNEFPEKVMQEKKFIMHEMDAKEFGIPIISLGQPLFDPDEPGKIAGAFGITMPRKNSEKLRRMAQSMESSVGEIAAVVE